MLNLLRAGDADAAAELLLDYVEEAWSRVRDATRTLEDLALLDVRRLDVMANGGANTAPPAISGYWAAKHLRWRAEALRHAGRFEEAIRRLNESLRIRGTTRDPVACGFLAMAHDRLGHRSEARRWLDRLTAVQPGEGFEFSGAEVETGILTREARMLVAGSAALPPLRRAR